LLPATYLAFRLETKSISKSKLKFVRVHTMKTDGGLILQRHDVLTRVLNNEGLWLAALTGRFSLGGGNLP